MKQISLLGLCATLFFNYLFSDGRDFLKNVIPKDGIGAEIGVWKGDFSRFLAEETQPKKLHLIDPWGFKSQYPWAMYGGKVAKNQIDMDRIYDNVTKRFSSNSKVIIHRLSSVNASHLFPDEYFDWIYIDGDHTYEGVMQDLTFFYPKVREGGLIIGDDYCWDSVKSAVDQFVKDYGIKKIEIKNHQFFFYK